MKLPNGENAFVDPRKLIEYCLNPAHQTGKHKARVFESRLGITIQEFDKLRQVIREAAKTEDATIGVSDEHGTRYTIDFSISGPKGDAEVRSAWIIRTDEDYPRLTSCYVL